jgi:hypothetical protein
MVLDMVVSLLKSSGTAAGKTGARAARRLAGGSLVMAEIRAQSVSAAPTIWPLMR